MALQVPDDWTDRWFLLNLKEGRPAGRGDDGGVQHRALAHEQRALAEVRVELGQDRRREAVLLKQPA